jgi:aminoglycoside/choline kinase family phosphotransferase/dTDP-glucose pyrophosphorylase
MKAMILAAGFGTRLLPHTRHTPKPLFTIGGRPLLDRIILSLVRAGCEAVIINTHHLHEQIERFVAGHHYEIPVLTRWEPEILGTGGAVKNVADFWDDAPFLVINSDIVFDIDLKALYRFHLNHIHPATLVLCDDPAFNSVTVTKGGLITGFRGQNQQDAPRRSSALTFTGIQVADPVLLNFIPDTTFSSIIDAYRSALASGMKIRAFIPPAGSWKDIGTPERYRSTAFKKLAPEAFTRAYPGYPGGPISRSRLKGDGSDRTWHRLHGAGRTLILADHGIRKQEEVSEVDSFIAIGRHLYQKGLPVPRIYHYDAFSGLVFMEDLGDVKLQHVIHSSPDTDSVVHCYESVIDSLIRLNGDGAAGFDSAWTCQTKTYSKALIIEKECLYFVDAFLRRYLGLDKDVDSSFKKLMSEFSSLADHALEYAVSGFMHRDMQSRNIMVKNDRFYFIDFQGGRIGPIQYDLASLLVDPYVNLPFAVRSRLLEYAARKLSSYTRLDTRLFETCFHYCAITRSLQTLGAFGFLSRVKGKTYFESYIPAAVNTLARLLGAPEHSAFPVLAEIVGKIENEKL